MAAEGVDSKDVGGFVVPRAVLAPVRCADFFPRIIELALRGEDFHCVQGEDATSAVNTRVTRSEVLVRRRMGEEEDSSESEAHL